MSTSLDADGGGVGGRDHPQFIHHHRGGRRMPCISSSINGSPEPMTDFFPDDESFPARIGINEKREDDLDSSTSSSIGRNSDSSVKSSDGDDDDSGENEVQSPYKGPLDTMGALEDVLPVKRGMSQFYSGKSKSYTSLADASNICSITEIVKPENAYTRKRKNLLAFTCYWAKSGGQLSRTNNGGLSKRSVNSSRSVLSLALMSGPESSTSSENSNSNSSSPSCHLPPLHPQARKESNDGSVSSSFQWGFSGSFRSFSLSDLQCVAADSQRINGPAIKDRG